MIRNSVHVRDAVPTDAAPLVKLWCEQVDKKSRLSATDDDTAERCIAKLALNPDERLVVAEADGEIIGVAQLSREAVSPIHEDTAVRVSHMFVPETFRRRGIGRALLSAAAAWADEKKSTHVMATISASSRDANRFLARLGLSHVANVRGAPTKGLEERVDQLDGREGLMRQVSDVRRRTLLKRRRAAQSSDG